MMCCVRDALSKSANKEQVMAMSTTKPRAKNKKPIVLKTEGLGKHYGGVDALIEANFYLHAEECVAIVGDNGAGKSTFIRLITGVEQPDSGHILFENNNIIIKNPSHARDLGIGTVYQDLALADDLNVTSNIFLGREITRFNLGPFSMLNHAAMRHKAQEYLAQTGIKIEDQRQQLRHMSGGQRQCIAISRAAAWAERLIIMDEPTAALGVQETAKVENIILQIKQHRIPIIIVSHNLRQVFDLVDTVWVFRRGHIVGRREIAKTNSDEIVAMITGAASAST